MLIELIVDTLSSSPSLFKLLQSLQSMRLFVSAKQANMGFVRVKSQGNTVPHWSPSSFGLHVQPRRVPKPWSASARGGERREKGQVCRNTSVQQVLN